MKNILISLILILILSSCDFGANLPMDKQLPEPYHVVTISKFTKTLCRYELETGTDYSYYKDNIFVIDSIGKFAIGDTLSLSINKRK